MLEKKYFYSVFLPPSLESQVGNRYRKKALKTPFILNSLGLKLMQKFSLSLIPKNLCSFKEGETWMMAGKHMKNLWTWIIFIKCLPFSHICTLMRLSLTFANGLLLCQKNLCLLLTSFVVVDRCSSHKPFSLSVYTIRKS